MLSHALIKISGRLVQNKGKEGGGRGKGGERKGRGRGRLLPPLQLGHLGTLLEETSHYLNSLPGETCSGRDQVVFIMAEQSQEISRWKN